MASRIVILGAGVTGVAAARASGGVAYEAAEHPGGICGSYSRSPGSNERQHGVAKDDAYQFEPGGGHWIFGGEPEVLELIDALAPVQRFERRSAVFFPEQGRFVPYPLQEHLDFLPPEVAARARGEQRDAGGAAFTFSEWLRRRFGATLCELFFHPFHELYTAGLCDRIAPQGSEKSPLARPGPAARTGAGYNASFVYPREGLDTLVGRLAAGSRIELGKRAVRIASDAREVHFADGTTAGYDRLLSTLPLDQTLAMAGLRVEAAQDPHSSVLVLNIGALRGPACPDQHWLYLPGSRSGFHRIGFYSNVDAGFLPAAHRDSRTRVSLYVERAFAAGARSAEAEERRYAAAVVAELQDWGFIAEPEVVDASWVETAYTWSWPGSRWRERALEALEQRGVELAGRYACWRFQGIADSIRDGLRAGARLREAR
ncbi:MAG TPA: FAD-dependent oxidoreductase [Myxococcota bacterium]|jgi:protoporphyrinogen oxidase